MADIVLHDTEQATVVIDDGMDIDIPRESAYEAITEYHRKIQIMRSAYEKLDSLPLSFGMPAYSDSIDDKVIENKFKLNLKDAMRRMKITNILDVEEDSQEEMILENQTMLAALKKFRLTASAFFKFSTAIDGKTVDKTKVAQALKDIINELEDEFKKYKAGNCGNIWTIEDTNLTGRNNRNE